MQEGRYELCLLHRRPELLRETAELINREWSRSLGAREASIEDSCNELPCSLVLTSRGEKEKVVGHARILAVAGRSNAALVETVVVAPELRGRGLGRKLMEGAEEHARRLGCRSVHLSTHDQRGFYSHLGYSSGPSVSPLRKCVARLREDQTENLLQGLTGATTSDSPSSDELCNPDTQMTPPQTQGPPPPPPPPPPQVLMSSQQPADVTTWMVKEL